MATSWFPLLLLLDCSAALLLQPSSRTVLPPQQMRASPITLCSSDPNQGDEQDVEEAQIFRKKGGQFKEHKPKDNRDKLLYTVTETTPPPTKLGVFQLDPSAGCGDLIAARVRVDGEAEKQEQAFIIKKVSYRYAYDGGSYKMVSKGAEVKMASRDSTEKFLNRLLPKMEDAKAEGTALDLPPKRWRTEE